MGSSSSSNANRDSSITPQDWDDNVYFSKGTSYLTVQGDSCDSLPSRFGRYWTTHKLYDMVILCRQQKFEVHRVILSALSEYFENTISDHLENDTLTLDYDPICMSTCLEYLYTGRVEVDRDRVGAVASLAKILDIPHLYNTCRAAELKDTTSNVDNCLDMWSIGETVGDENMWRRGKDAALANVDGLMEQDSFMDLSYRHLEELVSHDDLVVSSAGERLGAALVWIGYDGINRSHHLTSLLTALPLNEMSRIRLRQALNNPLVTDSPEASHVLQRMIENIRPKPNDKPSMASFKEPCLVSIGRLRGNGFPDNDSTVLVTPLSFTSKWFKLTDLPSSLPSHWYASVACYAVGSSLYVTGLGENQKETWHFSMTFQHWEQYGDLQHSRVSHCMVECGGTVYSLGGHVPGDSFKLVQHVEALDVNTKTWRVVGLLPGSFCINAACCKVGGEVLIHGILHDADNRLVPVFASHTELSRCLGSFSCGGYRGVCGVVAVADKIIMADNNGLYVCSASHHYIFHVAKRPLYQLPFEDLSLLHLSEDGQFITVIGGCVCDGSASHVYRARADDVIRNTGTGWQPVDMEWSLGEIQLVPGAHCTASIDLNRLSPI